MRDRGVEDGNYLDRLGRVFYVVVESDFYFNS